MCVCAFYKIKKTVPVNLFQINLCIYLCRELSYLIKEWRGKSSHLFKSFDEFLTVPEEFPLCLPISKGFVTLFSVTAITQTNYLRAQGDYL